MGQYNVLLSTGTLTMIDRSVTPNIAVPIAALTDISVDISWTIKELEVDKIFPIAQARTGMKVGLKAKFADVNGSTLSRLLGFGNVTSNTSTQYFLSPATAIPASPYQITPTLGTGNTWADDMGVRNAATGKLMTPVTGTPTAGQYKVVAGVYTFSSADQAAGVAVVIRCTFTTSGTSANPGQTQSISNMTDYAAPTFESVIFNNYTQSDGSVSMLGFRFYQLTVPKLSLASKANDFTMIDLDMQAYPRASDDLVGQLYSAP